MVVINHMKSCACEMQRQNIPATFRCSNLRHSSLVVVHSKVVEIHPRFCAGVVGAADVVVVIDVVDDGSTVVDSETISYFKTKFHITKINFIF